MVFLEEAHCPRFINADLIAAGLSPFVPETAALRAEKLRLAEIPRRAGKELRASLQAADAWVKYDNDVLKPELTEWGENQ